ncbi:MAG TPA: HepT-like ribonuclease domain-containing protein [Candidatus Saccharimonadales bacterium]|jgi:uncharacterized protein with HEPN domain
MSKAPEPFIGAAFDSLQAVVGRAGHDKADFMGDLVLQDATLMRLMDAGEQLARVRESYPEYYTEHASPTWNKLIGLRNIIAHGYLMIDFETVWNIIQKHLPQLISELGKLS